MTNSLTMTEASELFDLLAPVAFAVLDATPVSFVVAPDGYWTAPDEMTELDALFGSPGIAVAETGFISHDELANLPQDFVLSPIARATHISINPWFLAILDEDEVMAVLLHEIAHASGVWMDQHSQAWFNRAVLFGTATVQACFVPRNKAQHPYFPDGFHEPATMDVNTLILP